jgi:hypothetical protein
MASRLPLQFGILFHKQRGATYGLSPYKWTICKHNYRGRKVGRIIAERIIVPELRIGNNSGGRGAYASNGNSRTYHQSCFYGIPVWGPLAGLDMPRPSLRLAYLSSLHEAGGPKIEFNGNGAAFKVGLSYISPARQFGRLKYDPGQLCSILLPFPVILVTVFCLRIYISPKTAKIFYGTCLLLSRRILSNRPKTHLHESFR